MDIHTGLGESDNRTHYTAVSNTYNTGNTNSKFVNEPYGGIHFYESKPTGPGMGGIRDEEWTVKMVAASLPRHEQRPDTIQHDIWYKRLHLGEESPTPDSTLYKRMYDDGILFGTKYQKKLSSLAPVRPHPVIAKKILDAKNGDFPSELEHYLEFEYWYAPFGLYSHGTTAEGVQRTQTFLGIKQVPSAKSPVTTDTFDIDIKRTSTVTTSNDRTNQSYCFDKSEGGYYQLLRMSRTLAILLGIDAWEEQASFPHCSWTTDTPKPTNIKPGVNDKFYMKQLSSPTTTYRVLTIPPKWYTFDELAYYINGWIIAEWASVIVDDVITKDPDPQWTQCWFNVPPGFSINFDDTSAQHNCRAIFDVNNGVYTQKFYGSTSKFITPDYPPYLERLTTLLNTPPKDEAKFMTTYLTQFMSQPTTIQPQGVPGAKLFVTKRSFFVSILGRSYHPETSEYKIASDNADQLFDVLPDYGSMSKWKTFPDTVDGQYVDLLVCIRHPDAVAFSSTSYYDDPSKYKTIAYTAYVPVPIRPSLNAIYIPRGVPYVISEYLRDLMYLNHTVTVLAPKMVYENAVGGKIDNTVDCFQSTKPWDINPWTKQWFQILRPIVHAVRRDIFDNTLAFRVEIAHGTSTLIRTLSSNKFNQKAKDYYANNSILMIGDQTPVALMFVFDK